MEHPISFRNDYARAKERTKETAMYLGVVCALMGILADLIVLVLVLAIVLLAFIIFLRLLPVLILAALVVVLIWFLFYRRGPRPSVAY